MNRNKNLRNFDYYIATLTKLMVSWVDKDIAFHLKKSKERVRRWKQK